MAASRVTSGKQDVRKATLGGEHDTLEHRIKELKAALEEKEREMEQMKKVIADLEQMARKEDRYSWTLHS